MRTHTSIVAAARVTAAAWCFGVLAVASATAQPPVAAPGQPPQAAPPGQPAAAAPPQMQRAQAPTGPWMDKSLSPDRRAELVLEQMTLDEKLAMVHGMGGFQAAGARSNGGAGVVEGVPRLGIPDMQLADSAVGVRAAAERGRYSTLLPSTLASAATWDLKLSWAHGDVIGRELRDQQYNTSLGGGMNLTREPRNGRNFEYLSEDPILTGKMAAQWVKGLQSNQIIGDIKHYAFNNQETGRNIGNVRLSKRVARQTELLAFEIAVIEGQPGMVMCSYNKFNGDWACENQYLLTDVLKKAWGFKGVVMSDWGATHSTTKAALAGLDNEQPNGRFFGDALKKAIASGEVPMARLDDMVRRTVRTQFALGVVDNPPKGRVVDPFRGAETAQIIAEQGSVLLKNAKAQLPLAAATVRSIAVIGSRADVGVLSGGGSAQVDPPGGGPSTYGGPVVWFPSSPLKAIRAKAPNAKVEYADGADLVKAAALAKASDVAIVFVNQPTTEGRDSATMALPKDQTPGPNPVTIDQDQLVSAVAAANPRTVVVLQTGGPVSMPWIEQVNAAIEIWYPGIRGAEALANILFGDVNPSAKLPMTFPKSEKDLPQLEIPGFNLIPQRPPQGATAPGQPPQAAPPAAGAPAAAPAAPRPRFQMTPFDIDYTEGLKVGYKWFDAEGKTPMFPFGFGLSYTTFAYSTLKTTPDGVTFVVKNTGKRAGAEVAQVYVGLPASAGEPPRRLVAWEKVWLEPGATKTVSITFEPKLLSIFNETKDAWELLPGEYKVFVGGSSRDLPLTGTMTR